MATTISRPTAQVRSDATRRAGWLFIAAFAAIVLLAVGQGGFYAEMEAQLIAAALEHGGWLASVFPLIRSPHSL